MPELTPRQIAMILAALRLAQMDLRVVLDDPYLYDIATAAGTISPLTDYEIDELCELLNCGDLGDEAEII